MINYIKGIARVNKQNRFDYIVSILEQNRIKYVVQKIPNYKTLGNIIVELNPGESKKVVVSAHYDNAPGTPGANDNAAACSILLNTLLDLKDSDKHIEFVFFDLEECGFIGSEYYIRNNSNKISYSLNLDMCGVGENIVFSDHYVFKRNIEQIYNLHNCIKVDRLPPGDAYSFINQRIPLIYIINSTNHDVAWFKEYASGVMPNIRPNFLRTMHRPNDTIDTINNDQVEKIYNFVKDLVLTL